MLRYGVQQTDSGAGKERCPSRGIALILNRLHSDVPCHQAPKVAYIVMFVTQWHKKSDGKDTFFPFWMADPKRACKVRHAPAIKGNCVKCKMKENEKRQIVRRI